MSNGNGKPKNILFLSFEACAGDLAWRLKQEGCSVKWYVQSKADRVLYDGFLDKVDEWEPHKDWADLIIIDDIGFGALADRMRKEGKAVVGGSGYTDRLELDRDFGAQEMKAAGLTIPDIVRMMVGRSVREEDAYRDDVVVEGELLRVEGLKRHDGR